MGIFYVGSNSQVTRAGHMRRHEEEPAAPQGAAPKPRPQQASMASRVRALRSALD